MCSEPGSKNRREEVDKLNSELMPDAGKVPLDKAEPWGRGIVKEFKETVIQWWWAVSAIHPRPFLLVQPEVHLL